MQDDGPTKSSHPLGHSVTHTDTAQGKGGGQQTEEAGAPGTEKAGQGDAENAKSRDWTDPGKRGVGGRSAQEFADRKDKGGQGMVDKDR